MPDNEFLGYYCFPQGHLISYPIPGKEGVQINWVLYTKMSHAELAAFMQVQKPSQPLIDSSYAKLQYLAKKNLPQQLNEMIEKSNSVFYQIIYDGFVPSVSKNNVILMGDASKVLRPHLGSGAAEGIRQAFELANHIEHGASLMEAISNWTEVENMQSQSMVSLARRLGDALVTNTPDWDKMTHELMDEWWKAVMTGKTWYVVDDAVEQLSM